MPLVNIKTWHTPREIKEKLMKEITRVYHEQAGVPLDKITVIFEEIHPESWSEAGVLGSDPSFREKSRRLVYDNSEQVEA